MLFRIIFHNLNIYFFIITLHLIIIIINLKKIFNFNSKFIRILIIIFIKFNNFDESRFRWRIIFCLRYTNLIFKNNLIYSMYFGIHSSFTSNHNTYSSSSTSNAYQPTLQLNTFDNFSKIGWNSKICIN